MHSWPTVEFETWPWESRFGLQASRRLREAERSTYSSAITPEIAGLTPQLPTSTVALIEEAAAEIARFDAEVGREVAPFASVLLRSESASSSMIENLTSGAKAIALAELGSRAKQNATEIVGNVDAMRAALALADRLDEQAVLDMHSALLKRVDKTAGQWRTQQVWIGGTSFSPHQAEFVPPHHSRLPEALADLMRFVRRTDLPVLAHVAIAHAQFETIHPFPDGNGRTGRALIHAMLRSLELTRLVTVPVSAGLLTDTKAYFESLIAYRHGDPVPIIDRVAEASLFAVLYGRQLVADLNAIRAGWEDRIEARRGHAAWRLADLLLRQPVVDSATIARELDTTSANAIRPVQTLLEAGVLTEFTGLNRNRMWQSSEVLAALDAFADRAGRRVAG